MLARHVQNDVPHRKEQAGGHRLCEEVGEVVGAAHERHGDFEEFDRFANKEVPADNVLGPLVVLGLVCEVDGRLAVQGERRRAGALKAQVGEQGAEVHGLLRGFAGGDNLGFAQ
eukprot:6200331-Pleurochrysis_carterae.AAC.1